jgi:hypothetical protein
VGSIIFLSCPFWSLTEPFVTKPPPSYLIVDHTRSNFSISQTFFADTNNPQTNIIPIFPPTTPGHHLSQTAIAGIILGPVLLLIIVLVLYLYHRGRPDRYDPDAEPDRGGNFELPAQTIEEVDATPAPIEVPGLELRWEMGAEERHELWARGSDELSEDVEQVIGESSGSWSRGDDDLVLEDMQGSSRTRLTTTNYGTGE